MMANQLPPDMTASVALATDADGDYFPVHMGGKMLAYCNDRASAELIVAALNAATASVLVDVGVKGSDYAH